MIIRLKYNSINVGHPHDRVLPWHGVPHGVLPPALGPVPRARAVVGSLVDYGHEDWAETDRMVN